VSDQLVKELRSFRELWTGGYYEGNPLDPLSRSSFGQFGYVSVLYAIYLSCIKPYVQGDTVVLEIGPGRGAWTKCLLPAKHIWVMDALSSEHNRFFEYLGHPKNVTYVQVRDFLCADLPDDTFSYMFSFGCLCHISPEGVREYAHNLFPKLKRGCSCFWMVADYSMRNQAVVKTNEYSIWSAVSSLLPPGGKSRLIARVLRYAMLRERQLTHNQHIMTADPDVVPRPGRWFDLGLENAISLLTNEGYQVIDPNVGACLRDPIIHFRKP